LAAQVDGQSNSYLIQQMLSVHGIVRDHQWVMDELRMLAAINMIGLADDGAVLVATHMILPL
jgi:hypothetical protein